MVDLDELDVGASWPSTDAFTVVYIYIYIYTPAEDDVEKETRIRRSRLVGATARPSQATSRPVAESSDLAKFH